MLETLSREDSEHSLTFGYLSRTNNEMNNLIDVEDWNGLIRARNRFYKMINLTDRVNVKIDKKILDRNRKLA